ncbi:hypothetical protein LOD99_13292 [Oopsacas minuta]|uniref:Uncharacterized protein n=1 Tax=Oopsacas minuta TaxID=111878 RepID=A0AAV7KKU0_9METZ|nr:hypothetical protein LOD99_13292 [Oopsacas minuta]
MTKYNPKLIRKTLMISQILLLTTAFLFKLKDSRYMILRRRANVIAFRVDYIDFKSIHETKIDVIRQNRSCFESKKQTSINEAMDLLKDVQPDQINSDGIAVEEKVHNEGVTVAEDIDEWMENQRKQS